MSDFKKGVAGMSTRPFGEKFMETLVRYKMGYKKSNTKYYDMKDGERKIELKSTRCFLQPNKKETLYNQIIQGGFKTLTTKRYMEKANFQKINIGKFDTLLLGFVFNNYVIVYEHDEKTMPFKKQLINSPQKQITIDKEILDKVPALFVCGWEEIEDIFKNKIK